jgi:hypothetical protein
MPDITMCASEECPKKLICYRYVALADRYQSFFSEDPREKDGTCKYFWDIKLPESRKDVHKRKPSRTKRLSNK